MTRAQLTFRILAIVALAALVSGCGGAEAPVDSTTAAPPTTPVQPAPGSTVANGGAVNPAADPALGGDPALADNGATATIPDLSGGNVGGGLAELSGTSLFQPQAVESAAIEAAEDKAAEPAAAGGSDAAKDATTTVAPKFTGAVIYVDGVSHTVTRGASFPKGDPLFKLLAVSANDIEIELLAGEFTSGGGSGIFLDKGDLVSLVNSTEQLTFKVKYLRPVADEAGIAF